MAGRGLLAGAAPRLIGMAERAFDVMCRRVVERVAFDRSPAKQGVIQDWVAVPRIAVWVIDRAIQALGGTGVAEGFHVAALYAYARSLQIADGPDEVYERGRPAGAGPAGGAVGLRPATGGPAPPGL